MKIGLFYSTTGNNNGPGKVVSNLSKGLEMNGIEVLHNQYGDYNGCLQAWGTPIRQMNSDTVVGPNLCVLPTELPWIWNHFDNMVVPSGWVKEMYESFNCVKVGKTKLHVWAVGIDTDRFCPSNEKKEWDVLLYAKHRDGDIDMVLRHLEAMGLRVIILRYGHYTEEELIIAARKSKCCVLLTKTESQGIGYQEILSMGVPCYVLDKDVWDDYAGYSFPASSVPYFDEKCGVIEKNMNCFSPFYEKLKIFNPREYIVDYLSLRNSAKNYEDLLKGNTT